MYDTQGNLATTLAKSLWIEKDISNDYGRKAIKNLCDVPIMDFPKSPELIQRLIQIGAPTNSIICDFFAGSATTAHATMLQNAADNGRRKFIMVQLPESCKPGSLAHQAGYKTIADIAKERIRRAGKLFKGDTGFRVLKIDASNMLDSYYTPQETTQAELFNHVETIKPDRTDEDLLFQILLDLGVSLSVTISQESIAGHKIYFVGGSLLAACFEMNISQTLLKELAQRRLERLVLRDNGFSSDANKISLLQIFKQLSSNTDIRSI